MKIENIDVNKTLEDARVLLSNEKNISPAFKAVIEVLFLVITRKLKRIHQGKSVAGKKAILAIIFDLLKIQMKSPISILISEPCQKGNIPWLVMMRVK